MEYSRLLFKSMQLSVMASTSLEETMRSWPGFQLKRSVGLLHHATCLCDDGPTDELSGVEEVNVRSAPCLGKDDTRSMFDFLTAPPSPSNILLTLPGSEWQLLNFLHYLEALLPFSFRPSGSAMRRKKGIWKIKRRGTEGVEGLMEREEVRGYSF